MITNTNGEVTDGRQQIEMRYITPDPQAPVGMVRIRASRGDVTGFWIPYQEFIEMANEIIRQKEEHNGE